jgi:hypothetical protein
LTLYDVLLSNIVPLHDFVLTISSLEVV